MNRSNIKFAGALIAILGFAFGANVASAAVTVTLSPDNECVFMTSNNDADSVMFQQNGNFMEQFDFISNFGITSPDNIAVQTRDSNFDCNPVLYGYSQSSSVLYLSPADTYSFVEGDIEEVIDLQDNYNVIASLTWHPLGWSLAAAPQQPAPPAQPALTLGEEITAARAGFASTTGFDVVGVIQWSGDNLIKLFIGSFLAIIYELRYWIAAALIIGGIVGFATRRKTGIKRKRL